MDDNKRNIQIDTHFPARDLIPKSETGATEFISAHSNYDGRGVIVAIFDTGCDPGTAGLQITSDGKPKYLDFVDGTGSGDVDTSTSVTSDSSNVITGLTGRQLKLNPTWKNPSKKFYIGIKRGYELFPKTLVSRVQGERRRKWDAAIRLQEAQLLKQIADYEPLKPTSSSSSASSTVSSVASTSSSSASSSSLSSSSSSSSTSPSLPVATAATPPVGLPSHSVTFPAPGVSVKPAMSPVVPALQSLPIASPSAPVLSTASSSFSSSTAASVSSSPSGPLIFSNQASEDDEDFWDETDTSTASQSSSTLSFEAKPKLRKKKKRNGGEGGDSVKKASSAGSKDRSDKTKTDLEDRLAELRSMQKSYADMGPVYDCVVFHDGQVWRAAVDGQESGDLSSVPAMTNYRLEREHATFSDLDLCNYTVNIYNDGKLLSIVANAGSHGTHVAGIVGAWFPRDPNLSGIAPGCQLISVKIGDTRLGSMETGSGLHRAIVSVIENKCDLVNMSYGEATSVANVGLFCELASDLVRKHGVVFVGSAGNEGPALSTVGAPGGTTDALIGVGAYVSPSMMRADYHLRDDKVAENQYTWCSRGPTYDGALGVCVSAMGGAIAPIPTWTLAQSQLMNGTSMSSPSCCGAIALLISALKQEGLAYSPISIRRAIENTARPILNVEKLAQGQGLVQVPAAFEYLRQHKSFDMHVSVKVAVTNRGKARGVYLREPFETNQVSVAKILIEPTFPEPYLNSVVNASELNVSRKPCSNRAKIEYEVQLSLVTSGDVDWVSVPKNAVLINGGRNLEFSVDPTRLPPGAHVTEVLGYDVSDVSKGPVFRVPVTVIRHHASALSSAPEPEQTTARDDVHGESTSLSLQRRRLPSPTTTALAPSAIDACTYRFENLRFIEGHIERRFLAVPAGATWADFVVRTRGNDSARMYLLHAVYHVPQVAYRDNQLKHYLTMGPDEEKLLSMAVVGSVTLEVVLSQFWNSLGPSAADLQVHFHGIVPSPSDIFFDGSKGVHRIDIEAPLRPESVNPSVSVTGTQCAVRPSSGDIETLFVNPEPTGLARDLLPESRPIYALNLSYDYDSASSHKVTPRFPLLQNMLYESPWAAQFYMFFDSNKSLIGSGDAWPPSTAVEKGKYTLRLQVRHEKVSVLESLKDMPCLFEIPIKKVEISVFHSLRHAVTGGASFRGPKAMRTGERRPLFISVPKDEQFVPGQVLIGSITFGGKAVIGEGKRPGGWPVKILVPPEKKKGKADSKNSDKKELTIQEEIRDSQLSFINGLSGDKQLLAYKEYYPNLLTAWPAHLPALSTAFNVLASSVSTQLKTKSQTATTDKPDSKQETKEVVEDRLSEALTMADQLIAQVDTTRIAAHYGRNLDPEDEEGKELRKEMDKTRSTLVGTLQRKAELVMEYLKAKHNDCIELGSNQPANADQAQPWVAVFRAVYAEFLKWSDAPVSSKPHPFLTLALFICALDRTPGTALKVLNNHIAKTSATKGGPATRALLDDRIGLLKKLGWEQWVDYEKSSILVRFPKSYTLF